MPPRRRRRGLGDLRALPRRHRLGDHRRGRRPRSARTRYLHRRFLADFYAGDFPGSFARGARFQPDPRTGEARTSGTAASLAGLESALERGDAARSTWRSAACCCCYAVAFAYGGLPLIYMGDELGLRNDAGCADDPAHARRQPLDAPAADGLGGGRAAARPGDRRGPAVGGPAAAGRGAPRDARGPRPGRDASRCGPATTTSSACCASTAGERLLRARELHRRPAGGAPRRRARPRLRTSPRPPPSPTAAPLRVEGDFLVLAPYQSPWLRG